MSNVKRVHIEAKVPFDWMHQLDDHDAALCGRMALNPAYGLRFNTGYVSNDLGETCMYLLRISGEEAIPCAR